VLISQVPRDAVDDAVEVCGVREKRSDGKLPARVTAYLTLALSASRVYYRARPRLMRQLATLLTPDE